MNSVTLVVNIAGDIYSGKQNERSLLRLLMISGRPRLITGIRTVLLDGQANEFYSSLRKGSEIGILGHITNRWFQHNYVSEVEVRNLVLLRNYSWAEIESRETMVEQGGGKAFIEGKIVSKIIFEWRQRITGKFLGINDQYAFLQFSISNKTNPDGMTILVYGSLAELLFPYLDPASEVAVDGLLRQDQHGRWGVVAENVALLRNIDYIRAAAAQSRRMQMWEIDEMENGE
jgi:single-stranded DNA-binding protein